VEAASSSLFRLLCPTSFLSKSKFDHLSDLLHRLTSPLPEVVVNMPASSVRHGALQGERFASDVPQALDAFPSSAWLGPSLGVCLQTMCHGDGKQTSVVPTSRCVHLCSSLLGASGSICACESTSVLTVFPIDVIDPREESLASYYSFSSTSIHIKGCLCSNT
jgi:hypothetical protein